MSITTIETQIERILSNLGMSSTSQFLNHLSLLNDINFLRSNCHNTQNITLLNTFYTELSKTAFTLQWDSISSSPLIKILAEFNFQYFHSNSLVLEKYFDAVMAVSSCFPRLTRILFTSYCRWFNMTMFSDELMKESLFGDDFDEKVKLVMEICGDVHLVVKKLCKLMPLSSSLFLSSLCDCFPLKTCSWWVFDVFVGNLCVVMEYLPSLSDRILNLIIHRMNEIDLMIPSKNKSLKSDIFDQYIFNQIPKFNEEIADFVQKRLIQSSSLKSSSLFLSIGDNDKEMENSIKKIDKGVERLCRYFRLLPSNDDYLPIDFIYLLLSFDRLVLPNIQLTNTPLIIFYATKISTKFSEKFIRLLLDRIFDNSREQKIRRNSVDYLTSYAIHSNHLSKFDIVKIFEMVLRFSEYLAEQNNPPALIQEQNTKTPILGLFYKLCESVMMIYVHRFDIIKTLLNTDKKQRIINLVLSKLSPLQYCSRQSVISFSALAFSTELIDVFPVMLCCYRYFCRNRSNYLFNKTEMTSFDSLDNRSRKFFRCKMVKSPFGDFVVKNSLKEIKLVYRSWQDLENNAKEVLFRWNDNEIQDNNENEVKDNEDISSGEFGSDNDEV